jgi:hypothetical protein
MADKCGTAARALKRGKTAKRRKPEKKCAVWRRGSKKLRSDASAVAVGVAQANGAGWRSRW